MRGPARLISSVRSSIKPGRTLNSTLVSVHTRKPLVIAICGRLMLGGLGSVVVAGISIRQNLGGRCWSGAGACFDTLSTHTPHTSVYIYLLKELGVHPKNTINILRMSYLELSDRDWYLMCMYRPESGLVDSEQHLRIIRHL